MPELMTAKKTAGIIGLPVEHSLSPLLQNAAFAATRLSARYLYWPTELAELPARVESLRTSAVLGANVTLPHKIAVAGLLDELSAEAEAIGAVNTIINRQGNLTGHNTDCAGFSRSLLEFSPGAARTSQALVLGAGGGARAIVYALLQLGIRSLRIANRHLERAEALCRQMEPLFAGAELVAVPWQPLALTRVARSSQLLVNTTSIGMGGAGASGESPLPGEALRADLAVYDIIYTPAETELVRQARRLGAPASNGLDMLVYQGAEAFTLWTGVAAPTEVMRSAARAALAGREGQ